MKDKINGSIMLITHDLGVIAGMADYVVVMYAGRVIERGTVFDIFDHPMHPYTVGLQKSKPVVNKEVDRLYSIPGNVPNPINMPSYCYFKDRCNRACEKCNGDYPELVKVSDTHYVACHLYTDGEAILNNAEETTVSEAEANHTEKAKLPDPPLNDENILDVRHLKKYFPASKNFFGKPLTFLKAVDDVSFTIKRGQTLGIVGESGCGKTTLGRTILKLHEPTEGEIYFEGNNIFPYKPSQIRILRCRRVIRSATRFRKRR